MKSLISSTHKILHITKLYIINIIFFSNLNKFLMGKKLLEKVPMNIRQWKILSVFFLRKVISPIFTSIIKNLV